MTILVDSSVWVDFLRGTPGPATDRLKTAIAAGTVATTDVVVLEVLAGAGERASSWASLLRVGDFLAQQPWNDVLAAAEIYRACRRGGATLRSTADCLVAAVAIRADVAVLHNDQDFDTISAHTALRAERS